MQNENGPCPLLAICNILLFRKKIEIHPDYPSVTFEELIQLVGDFLLNQKPSVCAISKCEPHFQLQFVNPDHSRDYEQNVSDALSMLPQLAVGLDVNVTFSEYALFFFFFFFLAYSAN